MKKVLTIISLPLLFLHLIVRFFGNSKYLYDKDQNFTLKSRKNLFSNRILQFAYFTLWLPEYRSLFYKRAGLLGHLMSVYLPGQRCLYIRTDRHKIGGGISLNHAHSTEVNAGSIGCNCIIFQNVTIGTKGSIEGPKIGNNVFFGTGCVVLGNITIGNNVKIGANAIVVKDIPDNCTVVSRGTVIVKKDGEKVNIPL